MSSRDVATEEEGPNLDESIKALLAQWRTCVNELQQLQELADSCANKSIRGLSSLLKVQQRALDKLCQKVQIAEPGTGTGTGTGTGNGTVTLAQYWGVKSCCWDDKWSVIKKCRGLVAINKEFPRSPRMPVPPGSGWLAYKDQPLQEKPIAVDAVIDSGATWLKFVSISPKSLAYQVVAEGWESEPESGDEDEEDDDKDGSEGLGNTEFADNIKKIVLAARWNHCRHIHLVLPSLREPHSEAVERMLTYVRTKIGAPDVRITISCAGSSLLQDRPPPLQDALTALVGGRDALVADDCGRITETVNLDPSVLVSLVTDLHHGPIDLQPLSQQKVITKSLLDHETDNNDLVSRGDILAEVLYPALRGRKLVCTRMAVRYFRQLIKSISTRSEEVRASLILPPEAPPPLREPDSQDSEQQSGTASMSASDRRRELQKWSSVPVPEDLHLPIEIVPDVTLENIGKYFGAEELAKGRLSMVLGIANDLSPLNRSVYLHGWSNSITTLTGHRGIERQIQLSLAAHWVRGDESKYNTMPPDIWHRHIGGYLVHRDKPKDWRTIVAEVEGEGAEVPKEVIRWTNPWTTWGRGISTYGLPDTKTWEGVGHEDKTSFGRRMVTRETRGNGSTANGVEEGEEQEEYS